MAQKKNQPQVQLVTPARQQQDGTATTELTDQQLSHIVGGVGPITHAGNIKSVLGLEQNGGTSSRQHPGPSGGGN